MPSAFDVRAAQAVGIVGADFELGCRFSATSGASGVTLSMGSWPIAAPARPGSAGRHPGWPRPDTGSRGARRRGGGDLSSRITGKRATRWPRRVVPAPPARTGSRGRPRPGRWRAATHGGRRRRRDVRWRRDGDSLLIARVAFRLVGRAGPRSTERGCPRTPYRSSMASISRAERSEGSAAGNAAANATISSVSLCARRDPGRERSTPPPVSASSPPRRPAPAAASSRVRYPPDSCPPDPDDVGIDNHIAGRRAPIAISTGVPLRLIADSGLIRK